MDNDMKHTKIAVLGGDRRSFFCAEALWERGYETALYGFDRISDRARSTRCRTLSDCLQNAAAVILPLPAAADGENVRTQDGETIALRDVFSLLPKKTPVFGGLIGGKMRALAEQYDLDISDYAEQEAFRVANAAVTAEGALFLAMQNSERTLCGASCLVTGYGRIGSVLCRLLSSLGARVTVCVRRTQTAAQAEKDGVRSVEVKELPEAAAKADVIFNTVPAEIFTPAVLERMNSRQLYVELASPPYGLTAENAASYNIERIDGARLPRRYAPESAGETVAAAILKGLEAHSL